ncbi:MAG: hypothetical protein K0Q95_660 [Bacteroidota bacterium]|jgi:hypothetical protein|nr:hypothetical protein [Bacteroidota bacterium]
MRVLFFTSLFFSTYCFGNGDIHQKGGKSDSTAVRGSSITIHLELSGRIGGGITSPQWATADGDSENKSVAFRGGKTGTFCDLACQITVAGAKRFSLILEPGYALTSQSISYCYSSHGKPASSSSCGSFNVDIKKTEAALLARIMIVKKWRLYLLCGGYGAREDSRIITGKWTREFTSYLPYQSSESKEEMFNKKHALVKDQLGLIGGIGLNLPLKNKTAIFIDLRMNIHSLKSGFDPTVVRMMDLGVSIGYTFYKSKSIKVDQIPANDY